MPPQSPSRRSPLLWVAIGVVVLLLGLLLWLQRRPPASPRSKSAPAASPESNRAQAPALSGGGPGGSQRPAEITIRGVTFDKERLCADDDIAIHIDAVDQDGQTTYLEATTSFPTFPVVGLDAIGRVGWALESEPSKELPQEVEVTVSDVRARGAVKTITVPLKIERCDSNPLDLSVLCTVRRNRHFELIYSCAAQYLLGNDPQAATYTWRAGPSPRELEPITGGEAGRIMWTQPRQMETSASITTFFEATGTTPDGKKAVGRTSVSVPAAAFRESLATGRLQLVPELEAAGTRTETGRRFDITTFNPFGEDIELTAATYQEYSCAAPQEQPAAKGTQVPSGAALVRSGVSTPFTWSLPDDSNRCFANLHLTGKGLKSGLPAELTVPVVTRDRPPQVSPEAAAIIEQARRILSKRAGKPVMKVNAEDIEQLEAEGALPPGTYDRLNKATADLPNDNPGGPPPPQRPQPPK